MAKRRTPHCASAWHFQRCLCKHERQSHQSEDGVCMVRPPKCDCRKFDLAPGYPVFESEEAMKAWANAQGRV
jgi:hypothetical protein